jgi:hypothetical protein
MRSPALRPPGATPLLSSMALLACPPSGRVWLGALLGELAVIEGVGPRTLWFLGALRLIVALNWDRAVAFVASPFAMAGCLMAAGAGICAALFVSGCEALLLEDDAFLLLALLSGLTSAVFFLQRVLSGHGRAVQASSSPKGTKGGMPGMNLRFGLTAITALAIITGAIVGITNAVSAGKGGILDDGKQHLSNAGITLDEAIASAQSAAAGPIDEVDLEYWQGKLVFNVDVGDKDVKVDASTGVVLSASSRD